jgi:glyoxylase-like metal-dependent hydrolase (beta-lactamase superfamily II)
MKKIKLHLNYAGYCTAKASHAVKTDPKTEIKFRALFGVIKHPEFGLILFDTGYTRKFYDVTNRFPNKIYALLTKVYIEEKDEIKSQLIENGYSPLDVKHVIISHFHGDHIAGLTDFPNAKFYCSKIAWEQVKKIPSFWGFRRGILKKLIPSDFETKVQFFEEINHTFQDDILGHTVNIFEDNSILAFNVPGHARGQIGIKIKTEKNTYLLIADTCWDKRAFEKGMLPNPIVKLFFDSWQDYLESITKISKYHKKNPDDIILPTHCHDSCKDFVSSKMTFNDL